MAIVINVHNIDVGDLFLTIFDLNVAGAATVDGLRMHESDIIQVAVQEGENERGNIRWSVERADDSSLTAERMLEVAANTQVDVTTNFG